MPYETLQCIISLRPTYTKEVTYTTTLLYDDKHIIGRLYRYFCIYFYAFSAPTAESLFLLVMSILAMESAIGVGKE